MSSVLSGPRLSRAIVGKYFTITSAGGGNSTVWHDQWRLLLLRKDDSGPAAA